jgi:hypothetical protein
MQPGNIYEFGAHYFEEQLRKHGGAAPSGQPDTAAQLDTGHVKLSNLQDTAAGLSLASMSAADLEPLLMREHYWLVVWSRCGFACCISQCPMGRHM